MWMIAAIMSAVFAGLTAILAKCGIKKTDSDIATALECIVVLLFAWIMVFITGSADTISRIALENCSFFCCPEPLRERPGCVISKHSPSAM